jgi:hypothetical protein
MCCNNYNNNNDNDKNNARKPNPVAVLEKPKGRCSAHGTKRWNNFNQKMAVFWVVAPCHRPDDGGSKDL